MIKYLLLLAFSLSLHAQVEDLISGVSFEQNPAHLNWKKIDTEHFEIIFPEEVSTEAKRVAHLLEKAYPFVVRSLDETPPRISLVLQNQSTSSNGFVTLAPRRSEWYLTPTLDPELNNTEWLKTLAVHEFRHVVQFQKGKRGFNKFLYVILGEIGQAVGLALTMPPWFFEGDAVGIETALTDGGRGRLPLFERDLRTLLLSGKDFDYDKAHIRSYEDYVPNHYIYGYFLTSAMRNREGDLFLSRVSNLSAESSWNPLSFYNSMDRLVEGSFEDFYLRTMRDLISAWKEKADQLEPSAYEVQNIGKRFGWTNYSFPQLTDDGKILVLKRGLSFLNQFVLLDGNKEEALFYPGPLVQEYPYKVRGSKLAFVELEVDPRWGYRDYSRLKVYDLKRRKFILDQRKTKWRLALLNQKGEKILAVRWDEAQGQALQVLSIQGEVLSELILPREEVITSIDWLNDQEAVLVVKDYSDLKTLLKIDLKTGERSALLPPSQVNYGFVTVEDGEILIESPESGIDNIFLVKDQRTHQITSSRFGAYAPQLIKGRLLYNDYTVEGMNVVEKRLPWDQLTASSGSFVPFYEKYSAFEGRESFAAKLAEAGDYQVKDYSQFKNAVNFHSWMIIAPPLSSTVAVAAFSRDILNKFTLTMGAQYDLNEHSSQVFAGAVWTHLYPVFDLKASYGGRRQNVTLSGVEKENRWEEGVAETGLQIPWRSIVGRFNQNFTLRAFAKLIKVTNKISSDRRSVNDGALFSPGADLSFSFLSRKVGRDLLPPWGIQLDAHYEEGRDITGEDQRGRVRSVDSRFYLPGAWYHHSFYHQLAYEKQEDEFYQYSSFIFYPRGTRSVFLQEFLKYSGNYTLPLFYPDWHWSRYIYFKRIAGNLFYDELRGRYGSASYEAASWGWELLSETYFVRLLLPVTIGLRGSYILRGFEKDTNYEVFITTGVGEF